MAGRPPKPTNLKVLEGNRGRRSLSQSEPQPRPVLPDPPPYLSEVALQRWHELLPELDYTGVLTRVDGDVLACYCMAYGEIVELAADVARNGRTYEVGTNGAQSTRPEVTQLQKARDDLRRFGAELGIGAASRTKIEVKKPDDGKSTITKIMEANSRGRTTG